MPYEIDFIGVGKDKIKQDADAICLRWKTGFDKYGNDVYTVGVIDGGFEDHGEAMVHHLNHYYFDDWGNNKSIKEKIIDFMIVTHSDNDHTTGLKQILGNFTVNKIYMNIPWAYEEELYDFVSDHRISVASLIRRLRKAYPKVAEIADIADDKGIPIFSAFQGEVIEDKLIILSPTKEFYLQLLIESDKTPLQEETSSFQQIGDSLRAITETVKEYAYTKLESWNDELLQEDVKTTPENESSVVLLGIMKEEGFLLTGDAGIRALAIAMNYSDDIGMDIQEQVSFYQIPHHGGRHNINQTILDCMLGAKVARGVIKNKTAFASAADGSDHPLKVVTNSYLKRGVKTYTTGAKILHHHRGNMPKREWEKATPIEFYDYVEE